ncbi:hypothetical protein VPFG_00003 [Vibrio phage nt-1]|uniref:Uncharacterized protein n=1 Tax=Vibrio phage nt-1 TaxID=115992 RepID=R9TE60_9CAUD|nr:hypothetical protein VPFG_00003 [Vibrio phage nt-1]AGN30011.1 hypothetical protein VPFG_00003 [Vibrio phage nt-1]
MEFLLVVAPVVGLLSVVLLALLIVYIISSIFKIKVVLPYGKIIAASVLLTLVFSGYKIATSPITRPTATEVVTDVHKHKVDEFKKIEAPVMKNNAFTPEEVDVTTLKSEELIKNHSATN